jgi:Putative stress-responsive transcriptional regulator
MFCFNKGMVFFSIYRNITVKQPKLVMEKKLFKSKDKKVCGVMGGLAKYFDIDPTVVRVAFLLLTIFTGFIPGLIAYVVMALVIPAEQ